MVVGKRSRCAVLWSGTVVADEPLPPAVFLFLLRLSSCSVYAIRHAAGVLVGILPAVPPVQMRWTLA